MQTRRHVAVDPCEEYFCIDLETSGLEVETHEILEIAVIHCASHESFVRRIRPRTPVPVEASKIHGLTSDKLQNERSFETVIEQVFRFIADKTPHGKHPTLIGYNLLKFDIPLLVHQLVKAGISTWPWSRVCARDVYMAVRNNVRFDGLKKKRLVDVYTLLTGDTTFGARAHGAEADARATMKVLEALSVHPKRVLLKQPHVFVGTPPL
jgi:DNA polymerase-3 subunit epsilon